MAAGKTCYRTHFSVSVKICATCESVPYWPSYRCLTDFKMAAAVILNLLPVSIFVIWSFLRTSCWCCCKKIFFINLSRFTAYLLSFAKKFKMAAAAILDYYLVMLDHPLSILGDPKSVFKFHVNS